MNCELRTYHSQEYADGSHRNPPPRSRRPLHDRARARPRGDGDGLSGAGPQAQPSSGDQSPAPEFAAVLGGERFLREIRLTANLQHPHILPLYDSGEAEGLLYYVMPFMAGETPSRPAAARTSAPGRGRAPAHPQRGLGARVRPSARNYPSRPQAREYPPGGRRGHSGRLGIARAISRVAGTNSPRPGSRWAPRLT